MWTAMRERERPTSYPYVLSRYLVVKRIAKIMMNMNVSLKTVATRS
jgi:hypothetical protein